MKRSIKFIIFTLMLALMLLPLSASAESLSENTETNAGSTVSEEAVSTDNEVGIITEQDKIAEDAPPPDNIEQEEKGDNQIEQGDNNDAPTEDENTAAGAGDKGDNPFEMIYNFATLHIGEIFSILSFISAALVALLYNKGLLPALKNSLSAMANILSGVKDSTEKSENLSNEMRQQLLEKLDIAEGGLKTMGDSIATLTERLDSLTDSKDEQEKMRLIMNAQIDMLYEIFLCSSLPEYQKEAVREKVAAMKEVLCCEKQENAD